MFQDLLKKCVKGETLTAYEAEKLMDEIMEGETTPVQIASLLTLLTYRGETVEEITGFVRGMRKKMIPINVNTDDVVDTCGTGGDGASTFNISTASAIVASSLGVKITKHGNRAVSSKSGSADVLERLGIPIQATEEQAIRSLEQTGMTFLFAPMYHPAMKHAAQPRKELGFRTVFNALGPLANPARCKRQVIGVYSLPLAKKLAETLVKLEARHVMLVVGRDGLDEISATAETDVVEVKNGKISQYVIKPEDFNLRRGDMAHMVVQNAEESAEMIIDVLQNKGNKSATNAVLLNAAAALYVAGKADSLLQGVHLARYSLDSGTAYRQLLALRNDEVVQHA
ncbi:anthranilate phosphoribosyltransferase [Bacillus songklensis]|uniref:Anthranilate phosphoribosyltransferase n=1 Tax=Bacillus songklensis TaxID=1069116 RepID=A0ABV8AXL9_9BACI